MTHKKQNVDDRMLTEVELEMMRIVWSGGSLTVRDVVDALPKSRDLAYTSVATVLKILENKGFLKSRKQDQALVYVPVVSKAQYESASLRHLARNVFQGDPSSMVMKLLNETNLSRDALEAIKKLIDERVDS